ncbi:MAG: hypothetical protein KGM42_03785 [Hyphomicrobiales bacterium]|nr:hypothetical protein [Hyphomicrobiales bacterium]
MGEIDHESQYRVLRDEILDQIHESRRLETYTLGALALFYTWLLTSGAAAGGRAVYWLAPPMVLLAAIRAWTILARIAEIAAYLREIEIAAFGRIADIGVTYLPPASLLDYRFKIADLYKADIATYNGRPPGWEQHMQVYGSRIVGRSALAYWLLLFVFTVFAAMLLPDIRALR